MVVSDPLPAQSCVLGTEGIPTPSFGLGGAQAVGHASGRSPDSYAGTNPPEAATQVAPASLLKATAAQGEAAIIRIRQGNLILKKAVQILKTAVQNLKQTVQYLKIAALF